MRQRLTENIKWARFVIVALGLWFIWLIINSSSQNSYLEILIGELIIILICSVLYIIIDKAKTIEIDDSFIYVIGKTETEQIPIGDIHNINKTIFNIPTGNIWKIRYYDKNKKMLL
ncbi:MAG: hypothetical protein KTR26_20455 [Flammeovirgaceae bacterium]|nr:hypothetical protein [Flammeovirgaceae bacterium]